MAKIKVLDCKQCGSEMKRHKFSTGNGKVLVGLVVIIAGLVLVVMWPVIGWVLGLLMVVIGLGMGGKRHKGWKCVSCEYFFETK